MRLASVPVFLAATPLFYARTYKAKREDRYSFKANRHCETVKNLDKLTNKAESIELELSKFRAQEAAILADQSRDDEAKLGDLLAAVA